MRTMQFLLFSRSRNGAGLSVDELIGDYIMNFYSPIAILKRCVLSLGTEYW